MMTSSQTFNYLSIPSVFECTIIYIPLFLKNNVSCATIPICLSYYLHTAFYFTSGLFFFVKNVPSIYEFCISYSFPNVLNWIGYDLVYSYIYQFLLPVLYYNMLFPLAQVQIHQSNDLFNML